VLFGVVAGEGFDRVLGAFIGLEQVALRGVRYREYWHQVRRHRGGLARCVVGEVSTGQPILHWGPRG